MNLLRTFLVGLAAAMARNEGHAAEAESVARVKQLVGFEELAHTLRDLLTEEGQVLEAQL